MSQFMPQGQGVPPELLAQLGVAGAPAPPSVSEPYDEGGGDPLATLQQCIQRLPGVLAALPDPRDVQDATKALLLLTGIQTRMMSQGQGPGQPGGR